jgi:hypothetical protein
VAANESPGLRFAGGSCAKQVIRVWLDGCSVYGLMERRIQEVSVDRLGSICGGAKPPCATEFSALDKAKVASLRALRARHRGGWDNPTLKEREETAYEAQGKAWDSYMACRAQLAAPPP